MHCTIAAFTTSSFFNSFHLFSADGTSIFGAAATVKVGDRGEESSQHAGFFCNPSPIPPETTAALNKRDKLLRYMLTLVPEPL